MSMEVKVLSSAPESWPIGNVCDMQEYFTGAQLKSWP